MRSRSLSRCKRAISAAWSADGSVACVVGRRAAAVGNTEQVESNIIEPVIERRMVGIPPALLLFAVLVAGILFGAPGVVIAAPLTVVVYVAVKKLYMRHVLGEETPVPGEKRD